MLPTIILTKYNIQEVADKSTYTTTDLVRALITMQRLHPYGIVAVKVPLPIPPHARSYIYDDY